MQPHDDSRHNDAQLRGLLREWQVPDAPAALEQRVLGALKPRHHAKPRYEAGWRFLFSGYIRVPVPLACGLALLLTFGAWRFAVRPPAPCVAETIVAPASIAARAPFSQTPQPWHSVLLRPDQCEHTARGVC